MRNRYGYRYGANTDNRADAAYPYHIGYHIGLLIGYRLGFTPEHHLGLSGISQEPLEGGRGPFASCSLSYTSFLAKGSMNPLHSGHRLLVPDGVSTLCGTTLAPHWLQIYRFSPGSRLGFHLGTRRGFHRSHRLGFPNGFGHRITLLLFSLNRLSNFSYRKA